MYVATDICLDPQIVLHRESSAGLSHLGRQDLKEQTNELGRLQNRACLSKGVPVRYFQPLLIVWFHSLFNL